MSQCLMSIKVMTWLWRLIGKVYRSIVASSAKIGCCKYLFLRRRKQEVQFSITFFLPALFSRCLRRILKALGRYSTDFCR